MSRTSSTLTRNPRHPKKTSLASLAGLLALILSTTSCNRVVLDERFYDASLKNWTVFEDAGTIEGPSKWAVEKDGWLHQRSNIWGKRGDFLGQWYGTYLVAGSASWKNYGFTVRAKPTDNDGFGVVFRFRDLEHYYRLLFIEDGMNGGPLTRLDRRDGGDFKELWSSKTGYKPGEEMAIFVEVDGDSISASVNGSLLCKVNDQSYTSGKIGLFCFAQDGQAFDDVRVVLK